MSSQTSMIQKNIGIPIGRFWIMNQGLQTVQHLFNLIPWTFLIYTHVIFSEDASSDDEECSRNELEDCNNQDLTSQYSKNESSNDECDKA